jgi:hypothetical protein
MLEALVLNLMVSEVDHLNVPEKVFGEEVNTLGQDGNLVDGA